MRFLKVGLVFALIAGIFFAGLSGGRSQVLAQDGAGETFVVMAGGGGGSIAIEQFAPAAVQVHEGDTVRWLIGGFHNIHFEEANTPLLLPLEQDGNSILQLNPAVMMGTLQSGGSFTGGDANTGLPLGGPPPAYIDVVMDADPGTYQYFCDVHAGMTGVIEVVDSAASIPTALDVVTQGFTEMSAAQGAGAMAEQAAKAAPLLTTDTGVEVIVSARAGQASVFGFFPNYVEINVGQTVTWTVPPDAMGSPFGIGSVPLPPPDQLFGVIPSEAGPPTIVIPDVGVNGSLPSGSTVGLADSWYTGILDPGESYMLSFSEPGVYRYTDGGPGLVGIIVVK
jgi:plastocyanin